MEELVPDTPVLKIDFLVTFPVAVYGFIFFPDTPDRSKVNLIPLQLLRDNDIKDRHSISPRPKKDLP